MPLPKLSKSKDSSENRPPTIGQTIKEFAVKTATTARNIALGGSVEALGSHASIATGPLGGHGANDNTPDTKKSGKKDYQQNSGREINQLSKLSSGIQKIGDGIERLIGITKSIKDIMESGSPKENRPEPIKDYAEKIQAPIVSKEDESKKELEKLLSDAKKAGLDINNERVREGILKAHAGESPSAHLNFDAPGKEKQQSGVKIAETEEVAKQVAAPVAATSGESPSGSYRQNERETNSVSIDSFGEKAVNQLEEIFKNSAKNIEENDSGSGLADIATGAGMLGGLKKLFKGKPKAPVKTPPKIPGRDPKTGRFVKAAEEVAETATKGSKGIASTAKGITKFAPQLLKGAGKLLGPAALIASSGLEAKERADEGQTVKQNAIGTASSAAGGTVGWMGGAAAGAALGSLAGPVGTVIGGGIGAVAGGIGGSEIGGRIADHFTGVGKPVEKQPALLPQAKDISSLHDQKEKKERQRMQPPAAPTIIAPQTTTVNQKAQNTIATGSDTRGVRGSLDLRRI